MGAPPNPPNPPNAGGGAPGAPKRLGAGAAEPPPKGLLAAFGNSEGFSAAGAGAAAVDAPNPPNRL